MNIELYESENYTLAMIIVLWNGHNSFIVTILQHQNIYTYIKSRSTIVMVQMNAIIFKCTMLSVSLIWSISTAFVRYVHSVYRTLYTRQTHTYIVHRVKHWKSEIVLSSGNSLGTDSKQSQFTLERKKERESGILGCSIGCLSKIGIFSSWIK